MKYRNYFLIGLTLSIAGCSGSIFKQVSIDDHQNTMVLDARQRVILVTDKGGRYNDGFTKEGKYNPKKEGYRKVVCTEPSPDVAVTLAAEGKLAIGDGKKKLEVGGKSSESIINISQRTQTIQLLRDGLFRACEAYMNGILGHEEYQNILNSYDDFVVTILAINDISSSKDKSPISNETAKVIKDIVKAYYDQQRWYIIRKNEKNEIDEMNKMDDMDEKDDDEINEINKKDETTEVDEIGKPTEIDEIGKFETTDKSDAIDETDKTIDETIDETDESNAVDKTTESRDESNAVNKTTEIKDEKTEK